MYMEDLPNHETKYISCISNASHTYGNLLATAEKWLLDVFSSIKFKTIHVNSRIAHSQIIRTPHTHLKKARPMLIISPRLEYEEDEFMQHTLVTERLGGPLTTKTPGIIDLNPFFFDGTAGTDMQYTLARRTMYLDVILSFDTMIQQINYFEFILNELAIQRPFDIDAWLEAFLPRELMQTVSDLSGIPIHSKQDETVTDFLNYMNSHSIFPVTYKLAGATGKEEFYRYYPARIITTIERPNRNDGDSYNQVMGNYTISFSMKMQFWATGITYLFSKKIDISKKIPIPSDSTLIPFYADVFLLEDLNLSPGWQVYGHASYTLDKVNDTVDFSDLIQQSIREVINYHIKNGIPLINFIDIKIRRMGKILVEGKNADYTIDYANQVVQFYNKEVTFYTYTIIVSIDVRYINDTIKEVFHLE